MREATQGKSYRWDEVTQTTPGKVHQLNEESMCRGRLPIGKESM